MATGHPPDPIYVNQEDVYDSNGRKRHSHRRIAFGWYGGKFTHLDFVLPQLPACQHYCEPFGGSAAVLLNRQPSPIETYNDIDGELVNFWKVLRDKPDELVRLLTFTPYSREEYYISIQGDLTVSDVERARRFFIRCRQIFANKTQKATLGNWARSKTNVRRNMSSSVSKYLSGIDHLEDIACRLQTVQIENRPAINILEKYDTPDTLFYCDPPYLPDTRSDSNVYIQEMTEYDYQELSDKLNNVKGMVAVSGYDHPKMDAFFDPEKWYKIKDKEKTHQISDRKRTEVMWTNFRILRDW